MTNGVGNRGQPGRDPVRFRGTNSASYAARTLNQWPLLVVLSGLAVGVVLVWVQHWRRGAFVMGAAVLLASGLRLVLPQRLAGLLAVRGRAFDVCCTVVVGAAIIVLALLVPPHA